MIRAAVILLCVVVGAIGAIGAELDAHREADALRVREGFRGVDGRLLERGPYQFRAITWRQHMPGVPFALAREEGPARACALKHIRWLAAQLEARGVPGSPFNVAAAWNAGLEQYVSGRAPVRAYRFAADVASLYSAAETGPKETDNLRVQQGGIRIVGRVVEHAELKATKQGNEVGGVGDRQFRQERIERDIGHAPNLVARPGKSNAAAGFILFMAHKAQPSVQVELPLQSSTAATWRECDLCGRRKIAVGGAHPCAFPINQNRTVCSGTLKEVSIWDL